MVRGSFGERSTARESEDQVGYNRMEKGDLRVRKSARMIEMGAGDV